MPLNNGVPIVITFVFDESNMVDNFLLAFHYITVATLLNEIDVHLE